MVRHTLKLLQEMLQDFKECLTFLGRYTLKSYISLMSFFKIKQQQDDLQNPGTYPKIY